MIRTTAKPLSLITCIALACFVGLKPSTTHAEPGVSAKSNKAAAAKPIAPLSERFANADAAEVPDFQKHVTPLLGRLGCNGRACHGSFQGRGGFQLSLFGYDFKADYDALMTENAGRVDTSDVDESLILAKPVDADMHEGGKRFDAGSWEHHTLRRWIEAGAKFDPKQVQTLQRLEVVPNEIQFSKAGEQVQLKAYAYWPDGSVEDVTALCRFSSNDDAIAAINEDGHIDSGEQGDTHVVVYYDNAVVPIPVIRPIGSSAARVAYSPAKPIDKLVQQKLNKLGVVPAGSCTDSEFIRRVSLDMTGMLPAGETVREFIADTSPDKREKLIEELLDSPAYAAWWATRMSDWTGNSNEQLNNVLPIRNVASRLWHEWLRVRLEDNVPYDQIVAGIVEANSRQEGESYREFCEQMTKACESGNEETFAKRDGMPLFWARRNFQKPEERAIGFAYAFLGVRIECAQCHKHPFDQWSKDDFEQFSQIFTPIRINQNQVSADAKAVRDELLKDITDGKKLSNGELRKAVYTAAQKGKVVPFGELLVNTRGASDKAKRARALAKKKGQKVPELKLPTGTILGQGEPVTLDKDPRPALMQWLRDKDNPYFAKAIVNRVWANYFGTGIVDPSDDMNLANPPSNAPLLDYLASEFIANNFDLKWLHREITSSETYARSAETNDTNIHDRVNFSRHIPRRLPAEVVYDAVVLATGSDDKASQLRGEVSEMAIAEGIAQNRNQKNFALEVFGQSTRESNCDCDRSDSPSLLQSIYLRNDADMHKRLSDKNGWVAQACEALGVPGPSQRVDPKQAAAVRAADNYRKMIISRVTKFNSLPKDRQKKTRDQIEKEYKRMANKFEQFDFEMPSLDSLIANPKSWRELEPTKAANKAASNTVSKLVDDAYLRTLSRFPDGEEREIAETFISESETPANGMESLMWALVNTKEFIITH
ncbi:DUF1549 and DUF1553 domain-containing protein [Novipirellula sp. SH528]|uniref:DUF1549 and DUF1553 domain-containing protein n=1 Tax=Novipirellula sp. SH528 TaxID=3454466 RepID=UPI003F9ED322